MAFQKGILPWNKGLKGTFKHTEEHKKAMSIKNKGKKLSDEHKLKISKAHKGIKHTEETKKKMSKSHIGMSPGNKGKHPSEETRKRLIESHKGKGLGFKHSKKSIEKMSGSNCHLWKGGKSFEIYPVDWTKTLKRSIRERDNYTCQLCSKQQEDEAFCVHHIDYDKKNCNPNNLITLCRKCHTKTNHNREYWTEYLNS